MMLMTELGGGRGHLNNEFVNAIVINWSFISADRQRGELLWG